MDYSYFQTIFDHYDLYASNISLTFYYKVYEGMTQEAMELDLADKISKLLHNYSDSIDNSKRVKSVAQVAIRKRLIIKRNNITANSILRNCIVHRVLTSSGK